MSYTPTHAAGIALAQLKRMVSLSSTFQTALSAADATAALALIHIGRSATPTTGAWVWEDDTEGISFDDYAGGDQLLLKPTGRLKLMVVLPVVEGDDDEDRYLKGRDVAGGVAQDVAAISEAPDTGSAFGENHLAIRTIRKEQGGPGDPRFDASRGLLDVTIFNVDWGTQG